MRGGRLGTVDCIFRLSTGEKSQIAKNSIFFKI